MVSLLIYFVTYLQGYDVLDQIRDKTFWLYPLTAVATAMEFVGWAYFITDLVNKFY